MKVTRWFVAVAVAEAFSWAALLAGTAVKYGPPGNEIGVQIFGPVHGACSRRVWRRLVR